MRPSVQAKPQGAPRSKVLTFLRLPVRPRQQSGRLLMESEAADGPSHFQGMRLGEASAFTGQAGKFMPPCVGLRNNHAFHALSTVRGPHDPAQLVSERRVNRGLYKTAVRVVDRGRDRPSRTNGMEGRVVGRLCQGEVGE